MTGHALALDRERLRIGAVVGTRPIAIDLCLVVLVSCEKCRLGQSPGTTECMPQHDTPTAIGVEPSSGHRHSTSQR
jgi:hypothetical protein